MRELELQRKLLGMQKSTESQLEEKVTRNIEEAVPRTVKSILSEELKTHAFKNKKQKISEHSSDVLNAIVLQNRKLNQYSKQPQRSGILFKLVGTSQNWPK